MVGRASGNRWRDASRAEEDDVKGSRILIPLRPAVSRAPVRSVAEQRAKKTRHPTDLGWREKRGKILQSDQKLEGVGKISS